MRHVRMLGLCLVALFALGAMTAGQALAKKRTCGPACEIQGFVNCPVEFKGYGPGWYEGDTCVDGESFYKEAWESPEQKENWEKSTERQAPGYVSHFTTGKVTVDLKNPIILRGALDAREESNGEGTTEANWVPAVGAATIEPVAQATIPLTKGVNASLLSGTELERYNYYVKVAHETKTTATIEVAGPVKNLLVDVEDQLEEKGTAFVFPVKVKLSNPFLGENCYVGSEASPIEVPFTTGQAGELRGKAGTIAFGKTGIITLWGDTLVSDDFSSPGVEGCGVGGGADEAIDSALGLPSASGNTSVINGVLRLDEPENVQREL